MCKRIALFAGLLALTMPGFASPQRTVYTHENQFPKVGGVEVNVSGQYTEIIDRDEQIDNADVNVSRLAADLRYGLLPELTLTAGLPLVSEDPDRGDSETGLGNLTLGLELRAWQDIFEYPFVIPHAEVGLGTASSDLVSETDDLTVTFGISAGTVTHDWITWVADASYVLLQDEENIVVLSGSVAFQHSKKFSTLVEVRATDEESGPDDDHPFNVLAGFTYDWNRNFRTSIHGGGGLDSSDDVVALFKASYFW